jgi:hypothetical protein
MSDQRTLQDREKQIATLRELRKRRHEERAGRPPRLLSSLDAPAVISKEVIKGLLKAEYENLVVSLYLQSESRQGSAHTKSSGKVLSLSTDSRTGATERLDRSNSQSTKGNAHARLEGN